MGNSDDRSRSASHLDVVLADTHVSPEAVTYPYMIRMASNALKCPTCLSETNDAASLKRIQLRKGWSNAPSEDAASEKRGCDKGENPTPIKCPITPTCKALTDVQCSVRAVRTSTDEQIIFARESEVLRVAFRRNSDIVDEFISREGMQPHVLAARGRGRLVGRLLTSHKGEPASIPGYSHVGILPHKAADRRVFSGIFHFPPSVHSGAALYPPRFTLIGSQDLAVKSHSHIFTPPWPVRIAIDQFVCNIPVLFSKAIGAVNLTLAGAHVIRNPSTALPWPPSTAAGEHSRNYFPSIVTDIIGRMSLSAAVKMYTCRGSDIFLRFISLSAHFIVYNLQGQNALSRVRNMLDVFGGFSLCIPVSRSISIPVDTPPPGATVVERLDCSPPTNANRVQYPADSLRIFASGNRTGRCRFSAGFLGFSSLPRTFIPLLLHTYLTSLSSTLKASMLRTAQTNMTTTSHLGPTMFADSRAKFDAAVLYFSLSLSLCLTLTHNNNNNLTGSRSVIDCPGPPTPPPHSLTADNHRNCGQTLDRRFYSGFPLVHTVFDTCWRTLTQSSPSTVTADNQCTVDIGISVHKTVESSLQVIELANFSGLYKMTMEQHRDERAGDIPEIVRHDTHLRNPGATWPHLRDRTRFTEGGGEPLATRSTADPITVSTLAGECLARRRLGKTGNTDGHLFNYWRLHSKVAPRKSDGCRQSSRQTRKSDMNLVDTRTSHSFSTTSVINKPFSRRCLLERPARGWALWSHYHVTVMEYTMVYLYLPLREISHTHQGSFVSWQPNRRTRSTGCSDKNKSREMEEHWILLISRKTKSSGRRFLLREATSYNPAP
ncbi:hypothetical protein PR048_018858, partial [Dryococelus australis]